MVARAERRLQVLLVEDDAVFVMCVRRAVQKAELDVDLHVAQDGFRALEVLRGEGRAEPLRPDVVLLDVNMPRMDGHEFLQNLRADPAIAHLVVFMLTTSVAEKDVERAYARNVAGYVAKADEGTRLPTVTSLLRLYQQGVVLPQRERFAVPEHAHVH